MIAQAQIINKILTDKDLSVVTLNNLDEKYFVDYKDEFNFILNHYTQYKCVPDKLTFANKFANFDFIEVSEPNSYLLEQLYKDYNDNYLATSFNKMKKLLEADKSEDALNYYMESVKGIHIGSVMTCTDLLADTSRYDRYLERTLNPEKSYLSTGFEELDKLVGGIDRANENLVIIARTGQGKTQVLLKMAAAASKQGLKVGIYEGEMTVDKVGYRLDTFLGNIKNTSINRGDLYIQKQYKDYIDKLAIQNWGSIKVFTPNDVPTGIVTVDTLKTFIEKEKLDILFVDQYDLLDDKHHAKVEYERIANIARDIKLLQVEKQIPIISVSQMNRTKLEDQSGNSIQDTVQVAGSDKIPRYATIMLALEQKQKEDNQGIHLILNVIKARDGGDNNKLTYDVNFNTGVFNYIPTEKDGVTTEEELQSIEDEYSLPWNDDESAF